jgi:hypothetical protein
MAGWGAAAIPPQRGSQGIGGGVGGLGKASRLHLHQLQDPKPPQGHARLCAEKWFSNHRLRSKGAAGRKQDLVAKGALIKYKILIFNSFKHNFHIYL